MTIPAPNSKDIELKEYSKLNQAEQGVPLATLVEGVVPPKTTTGRVPTTYRKHPPPYGLPEGGTWGTNTYSGSQTTCTSAVCCICGGAIPACIICCFPFDKRRAYMIDHKVYDANGSFIGTSLDLFRDEEFDGTVDQDQRIIGMMFAGTIAVTFAVVYLALSLSQQ